MNALYEYDLCSPHGRHTLRCEDEAATVAQLSRWSRPHRSPGSFVLDQDVGDSRKYFLGGGFYSVVRRVR